jgi:F420H(2)-dependent quinone reductase
MANSRPKYVDTAYNDFVVKWMSRINAFMYKRNNGEGLGGNFQGIPVAILTTTGRKSGEPRDTSTATVTRSSSQRPRAVATSTRCGT